MIERKAKYGWTNSGKPDLGRDYEMFSVLAGVRNSYGLKPIAEPRGMAEDACSEFEAWHKQWDSDAHSASWVTLAEMKAFDLNQEFYDDRLITSKDASGKITGTCASTSGQHLGPVGDRKVFSVWGDANWQALIAELQHVKDYYELASDDDVRLSFFFDN